MLYLGIFAVILSLFGAYLFSVLNKYYGIIIMVCGGILFSVYAYQQHKRTMRILERQGEIEEEIRRTNEGNKKNGSSYYYKGR